jgi:hypothetical protein
VEIREGSTRKIGRWQPCPDIATTTSAGVEFIDENGGEPGVRLRDPGHQDPAK